MPPRLGRLPDPCISAHGKRPRRRKVRGFLALACLAVVAVPSEAGEPGEVDASFRPALGSPGGTWVSAVAVAPGGRALASFANMTDGTSQVARLLATGDLDPDFHGPVMVDNLVRAIVIDSQGRIVIGGDFSQVGGQAHSGIARLAPDGTVEDWGLPALQGSPLSVGTLRLDSDDAVFLGGNLGRLGNQPLLGLARIRGDGTPDALFNQTATATLQSVFAPGGPYIGKGDFLPFAENTLLLVDTGKVRLRKDGTRAEDLASSGSDGWSLGTTTSGVLVRVGSVPGRNPGFFEANYLLRRFSDRGLPDPFSTRPLRVHGGPMLSLALPNDELLVAGDLDTVGGEAASGLVRLRADGDLDASFVCDLGRASANGGRRSADIRALALWGESVLVGGFFDEGGGMGLPGLARIRLGAASPSAPTLLQSATSIELAEGSLLKLPMRYRSFEPAQVRWRREGGELAGATNGVLEIRNVQPSDAGVYQCQISNRLGLTVSTSLVVRVSRTLATPGAIDVSFDANSGPLYLGSNGGSTRSARLPSQRVGADRVVVHGPFIHEDGGPTPPLLRLRTDGSVDESFDTGKNPLLVPGEWVTDLATVYHDGRVLASLLKVGSGLYRLVRFLPDGVIDPGFSPSALTERRLRFLGLDEQERIVITPAKSAVAVLTNQVFRLVAAGDLDAGFVPFSSVTNQVRESLLLPGGKVLVFLDSPFAPLNRRTLVLRLEADGRIDPTFFPTASVPTPNRSIVLQPDGRIVVGTSSLTPGESVVRLLADGQPDPSFTFSETLNELVYPLLATTEGWIYAWLGRVDQAMPNMGRLIRLTPSGQVDAAFRTPGGLMSAGYVTSLLGMPDGQLLAAGNFVDQSGKERPGLVKLFVDDERRLREPRFVAGEFSAGLWTRPGGAYVIETRSAFTEGDWRELAQVEADAAGGLRRFTEASSGGEHRLYRLRISK